jgi:hypothetical protein
MASGPTNLVRKNGAELQKKCAARPNPEVRGPVNPGRSEQFRIISLCDTNVILGDALEIPRQFAKFALASRSMACAHIDQ